MIKEKREHEELASTLDCYGYFGIVRRNRAFNEHYAYEPKLRMQTDSDFIATFLEAKYGTKFRPGDYTLKKGHKHYETSNRNTIVWILECAMPSLSSHNKFLQADCLMKFCRLSRHVQPYGNNFKNEQKRRMKYYDLMKNLKKVYYER